MLKECCESMLVIWLEEEPSPFMKPCIGFGRRSRLDHGNRVGFDCRGRELSQEYMATFAHEMKASGAPKHVKDDLDAPNQDAPLEAGVHSRSGCLSVPVTAIVGESYVVFCHWNVTTQISCVTKLMREANPMPDLCWWIVSVPSSFVWLTAATATQAIRPDGSSTGGLVIVAAHPKILNGEAATLSVLAWNSCKTRRVVRSSLDSEVLALSTGLEHTDMSRVMYDVR